VVGPVQVHPAVARAASGTGLPGRPVTVVAALAVAVTAALTAALTATAALGGGVGVLPGVLTGSAPPWWAEPALRTVRDVAVVLTTGLLLVTSGVLASAGRASRPVPPTTAARRWVVGCGLVAAAATAGHLLVVATEVSGTGPFEPGGIGAVGDVLRAVDVARLPVYAVVALGYVALAAARAGQERDLRAPAVVSLFAVALLGVSGHAGAHVAAMSVLAVHVLAASAWAGGLAALFLLRLARDDVADLLPRYSRIAGWCLAAVTASGLVAVAVRWDGGGIGTTWVLLATAKLALVAVLVVLGLQQRRRVVSRATAGEPLPWSALVRLGSAELLLMSVAAGLGVALAGAG
jgi:putative copper export protein